MSTTNNLPLLTSTKASNYYDWSLRIHERAFNTATHLANGDGIAGASSVFSSDYVKRLYAGNPPNFSHVYPPNPGIAPIKPVLGENPPETDEAFLKRMKQHRLLTADHAAELKAYTDFLATTASFKADVVHSLHPTDVTALSVPLSGLRTVSLAKIMDYMWDSYGRPTAIDMTNHRAATQEIYRPDTDLADFLGGINSHYAALAMNNEATNEATKVQHLIASVKNCGIFDQLIVDFERKHCAAGTQLYSGPDGLAKILIDEEKRLRGRMVGSTGFGNAAIGITSRNAEDTKTIAALTAQLAALQASAAHLRSASLVTKTCTDCNTKFDTLYHANVECKKCYELKKAKSAASNADAAKGAGGGRGGRKTK